MDEFKRVTEGARHITGNRNQLSGSPTVTATDGDHGEKVALTWSFVSGASYYDIYRNYTDSREDAQLIGVSSSSPFDDTNVVASSTYYYWVRGFDKWDFDSEFSEVETGYASP